MHLHFPHFHVTCRHDTDPTLFIRIVYNNYIVCFQVSHISPIHAWLTIVFSGSLEGYCGHTAAVEDHMQPGVFERLAVVEP